MERASFSGVDDRWWGPDAARGWMLLLIGVANAPYWMDQGLRADADPGQGADPWVLVRTLLVDQREHTLFALLIGFGCAVMARRLSGSGRSAADVAGLLRRRGGWLALIGGLHAIAFQGDVLGAYGLAMVLLAPLLSMGRATGKAWAAASISAVVSTLMLVAMQATGSTGAGSVVDWAGLGWSAPLHGLGHWALNSVGTLFTTFIVPCMLLGQLLADADWVRRPSEHRGRLAATAAACLVASAAGALPRALAASGASAVEWSGSLPVHMATGVLGAVGWLSLALLVLSLPWAARPRAALSALGSRSMDGYLVQTAFLGAAWLVAVWTGAHARMGEGSWALLGASAWCAGLLLAGWRDSRGRPGLVDEALRRVSLRRWPVASSAAPTPRNEDP